MATPSQHAQWNIVPAVAAWLLPGLGHMLLGERQRGMILMATIGILWLTGFLIGGVSVFDRQDHPAWFIGQSLMAPSLAANVGFNSIKAGRPDPRPDDPSPAYEPSFGRVNEQSILYTALAGLLNLLAILDVLYREPGRRRLDSYVKPDPSATGGKA
ncbi:MAG: hypothetical protein K8S99_00545 [Planctomycetes bacterium]|nr:hypothetical protein [Planctomycetota bacterium]